MLCFGSVDGEGCADGDMIRSVFCIVRLTNESIFGQSTAHEDEVDGALAECAFIGGHTSR